MSSDPRAAYLARAKQLEDQGQLDAATDAFMHAGAFGEAARIRMSQRRYLEAGQLLLRNLGVDPPRIGAVPPVRRKEALTAAICFAKGGRGDIAVEMFLGLGEHARAIELLERAGDQVGVRRVREQMMQAQHQRPFATPAPAPPAAAPPRSPIPVIAGVAAPAVAPPPPIRTPQQLEQSGSYPEAIEAYAKLKQFTEAARVCQILGRWDQAGAYYLEAAMPYEAAVCFQYAKDTRACLDALVMVPKEDPRYREAAVGAVTIASEMGLLDFRLEQFLGRFVASGPQNGREIEIFYLLAKLYQRHEKIESAREAFEKIVAVDPSFHDVRSQLAAVQAQLRPVKHLDSLPDLPEMPSLPTIPSQDRPGFDGDRTKTDVNEGLPGAMMSGAHPQPGAAPVVRTTVAKGATEANPEGDGFHIGTTVAGRYKIEDRIGKGGMAVVYRAHDLELAEKIAIKVFSQPIDDDELLLHRFKQELVLSRQLTHPNIIRLHDIGQWHNHRYITMELLHGRELKSQLGAPIPFDEGIEYLLQACSGLQHAHDRGVVHRDVKPQNFFITQEKQLKVMDFGIAKRQSAPGLTVAGMIAGTPNYMSPEQINGFSNVTASTDIYALGVIAYEMFTGTVPFTHPELMPILMMHLQTPPEPPRRRNPAVPEVLERVILRLMEKSPANRYPSCRALADELTRVRKAI